MESIHMNTPHICVCFDSTFTGENPIVFSLPPDVDVESWTCSDLKEFICSTVNYGMNTNDVELFVLPCAKLDRNRLKLIQEQNIKLTKSQLNENDNNNNNINVSTKKNEAEELCLFARSHFDPNSIMKVSPVNKTTQMETSKMTESVSENRNSPSTTEHSPSSPSPKRMKMSPSQNVLPTTQCSSDNNLASVYMQNLFNRYKNTKKCSMAQIQAKHFPLIHLSDNELSLSSKLALISKFKQSSLYGPPESSCPSNPWERTEDRQNENDSTTAEDNSNTFDIDLERSSSISSSISSEIQQANQEEDVIIFATLKEDKILLVEYEIEDPFAGTFDYIQFPISVSRDCTVLEIKSKLESVTGVQKEYQEIFLLSPFTEMWVNCEETTAISDITWFTRMGITLSGPTLVPWIILRKFAPNINLFVEYCFSNLANNNNLAMSDDELDENRKTTNTVKFVLSVPRRSTIRDVKKMIMKEPKVLETLSPKQCEMILYQLNEVKRKLHFVDFYQENGSIKEALTVRYQKQVLHNVSTLVQCNMRFANCELYKISVCVAQPGEVLRVYKCHSHRCDTLLDHCVHFLVDIMNDINMSICKDLAQLPVDIKQKILMNLAKKGMNLAIYHEALTHLFEKGMTWLSLEGYGSGSEQLLALLPHCTHLKYLNLSYSKDVTESVLIQLARSVPNLESLSIAHTQTSKQVILEFLQKCQKLQHLDVQRCTGVTGSSITDFIPFMSNLQELNISHNPSLATEQLKDLLTVTTCLESLTMDGYYLVNTNVFEQLFYHPSIKSLRLRNCQPPPDLVSIFKQTNAKLETLDLAGSNLNELTFLLISHRFPALSKLNLFGCQNLTDVVLEHIAVVYSTLKEIRLGMCNITHTSLNTLTSYCQQITTLDLRLCRHIKHFDSITLLKQLKELNLSGTSVNDHDLELITIGCSTLSVLYLVECHQITHIAPALITENSKSLLHLDLAGSVSVVDPIDQVLKVNYNPSLEYLNLEHLEISESSIPQIVTRFPRLKELYVYSWTSKPKIGHLHLVDIH